MDLETLETFLRILGISMLVSFVLFLLIIGFAIRRVRQLNIPPDANFTETLELAPFSIVLAIDLLDFALDFLAAPISWGLLSWLGLKGLRNVSLIEALLPFTQPIPTLTLCWIAVRWFGISLDRVIEK